MRVIILAAGEGKRMRPLTVEIPKGLLPVGEKTLLSRLLGQLISFGVQNITVVAGYHVQKIKTEVKEFKGVSITVVENDKYQEDVNILSLTKALSLNIEPFTVFESDIIFDDDCVKTIIDVSDGQKSIWFSRGYFQEHQKGGILKSDNDGKISDIKIVDKFSDNYKQYKKLIGVMTVGVGEVDHYAKVLFDECEKNIGQYYLIPWINNLERFDCYEHDLINHEAVSFNTAKEYEAALRAFI